MGAERTIDMAEDKNIFFDSYELEQSDLADASRRAMAILEGSGYLYPDELKGARSVLTAAAMTYVAAMVSASLQLLRLVLLFGNRRR